MNDQQICKIVSQLVRQLMTSDEPIHTKDIMVIQKLLNVFFDNQINSTVLEMITEHEAGGKPLEEKNDTKTN